MTTKKSTKVTAAESASGKKQSASCKMEGKTGKTVGKNTGKKKAETPAKATAAQTAVACRSRDIYAELPTGSKLTVTEKEADEYLAANFSLYVKECVHHKYLEDRNSIRAAVGLCALAWNLAEIRGNRDLKKSEQALRKHFIGIEEFGEAAKIMGSGFDPALELFMAEKKQSFPKLHDLILTWDFDLKTDINNFLIPFKIHGCAAEEAHLPENEKELF